MKDGVKNQDAIAPADVRQGIVRAVRAVGGSYCSGWLGMRKDGPPMRCSPIDSEQLPFLHKPVCDISSPDGPLGAVGLALSRTVAVDKQADVDLLDAALREVPSHLRLGRDPNPGDDA